MSRRRAFSLPDSDMTRPEAARRGRGGDSFSLLPQGAGSSVQFFCQSFWIFHINDPVTCAPRQLYFFSPNLHTPCFLFAFCS